MGIAIIYCAGFVTLFYAFMKYYVADHAREFNDETLTEAVLVAFLIALLWPLMLVMMFLMWLGPRLWL